MLDFLNKKSTKVGKNQKAKENQLKPMDNFKVWENAIKTWTLKKIAKTNKMIKFKTWEGRIYLDGEYML